MGLNSLVPDLMAYFSRCCYYFGYSTSLRKNLAGSVAHKMHILHFTDANNSPRKTFLVGGFLGGVALNQDPWHISAFTFITLADAG